MKKYDFACGCSFPIDESLPPIHGVPSLIYDVDDLPLECPITWDLISSGMTKGVFQLESSLGKQYAKKLKTTCIEHLSALGALLRPGCIGGDTTVAIREYSRIGRKLNFRKFKIRDLYEKFTKQHHNSDNDIISLDEKTKLFFKNNIDSVTYSGKKKVYRPLFEGKGENKFYDLECTSDHKLLTLYGWRELKDLYHGQLVAVTKLKRRFRPNRASLGEKSFRSVCLANYKYQCVLCDWSEGSLDVNHLEGNRKTDNRPENLCFLCPNHHRMYSEEKISMAEIIKNRKLYKLPNSDHIEWRRYLGKEYVGVKDTYDISVEGPHHNFLAGNVVVHNCLKAKDEDGVSMTDLFCLRKNGEKEISYYVDSLEPILNKTYGVLVYQEQAMDIAVQLAGFNPQEADMLRKAMGKKDTELMAKTKMEFVEKAKALGVLTDEQIESIFANIEKSQRYSFNKSHSVSYGLIGYQTAHAKAHFPIQFFTSYLFHAKEKQDPLREIRELVNDARAFGFNVIPPNFNDLEPNFSNDGIVIKFGLADVKGIGFSVINKMRNTIGDVEEACHRHRTTWSWFDFLIYFSEHANGGVVKRMIEVGAMADYSLPRQKMLSEYEIWKALTDKERTRICQMKSPNPTATGLFPKGKEDEPNDLAHGIELLLEVPKGVANKNRRAKVESLLQTLKCPPRPMTDNPTWVADTEEQLLGIPITQNRADASHESEANTTCKEYREGKSEKDMRLGVDIQDFREISIQKGDNRGRKMCFVTVSDKTGSLEDVTMFSDMWEKHGNLISIGNTVEIRGRRDFNRGSFIVEEVKQL